MKKTRIRLKDIAQKMSISTATVSRALRNRIEISEELRLKVKQVAKEMRYQPNFMATHLRTQKNYSIGVVIPRIIHQYLSSIISGILEEANRHHYQVMICETGHVFDRELKIIDQLSTGIVDGLLICVSNQTTDFTHLEQLKKDSLPFVLFDKDIAGLKAPKVVVDDYTGAFTAVEHLIEQGYRCIAHIQDNLVNHSSQKRMKGYFSALKKHGIAKNKQLVVELDEISIENSQYITQIFLQANPQVDAIFAITDEIAIGAMRAAQQLGKRVPEDFGVVGFSDWQISRVTSPPLTTVAQPGAEMGRVATRLLMQQIESQKEFDKDTPPKILKTKLIIRQSSSRI